MENKQKSLFVVTTQDKLSVLNTPAETYSHVPLTIIFSPSADFLILLYAVVLVNGCLSKVNENPWHQRLRVFPNICYYTDCSHTQLNPFHVIKFLIQHIQGFVPTSSSLKCSSAVLEHTAADTGICHHPKCLPKTPSSFRCDFWIPWSIISQIYNKKTQKRLENSEQFMEQILKSVQITVSRQYSVLIYPLVTPEMWGSHNLNQVCKVCCFYPSSCFSSGLMKLFYQNNINICLLLCCLETSVMFPTRSAGDEILTCNICTIIIRIRLFRIKHLDSLGLESLEFCFKLSFGPQ